MALAKAIKSMKTQPATVIKKPVIAPKVVAPPKVIAPPRPAPLPRVTVPTRVTVPARPLPLPPQPVAPEFPRSNFGNGFVPPFQPSAPEMSNPPQIPMTNFGGGLSYEMLQDLAGRYGLDANALFGNRQPQYPNQQMPNSGFFNQLPITRFPDTNQPFMPPASSPDRMTQYGENGIGYPASGGSFGQPSNGYGGGVESGYRGIPNLVNATAPMPNMGAPVSIGNFGQPSPQYNQMNPMQQPMQGYQQQPMLGQSSYQLQQPQQPPQQSMYPTSGGFGNTLPNQNQNQNIGGLFGAIESMNKNNFSY
jgi:hypothetical protein